METSCPTEKEKLSSLRSSAILIATVSDSPVLINSSGLLL